MAGSMAGVRRGAFTCVGWQVTLRDPICQVCRSSEVGIPQEELCRPLPLHSGRGIRWPTGWFFTRVLFIL